MERALPVSAATSLEAGDQEVLALESFSRTGSVFENMGNLTLESMLIDGGKVSGGCYPYNGWATDHNPLFAVGGYGPSPPGFISLGPRRNDTFIWSYSGDWVGDGGQDFAPSVSMALLSLLLGSLGAVYLVVRGHDEYQVACSATNSFSGEASCGPGESEPWGVWNPTSSRALGSIVAQPNFSRGQKYHGLSLVGLAKNGPGPVGSTHSSSKLRNLGAHQTRLQQPGRKETRVMSVTAITLCFHAVRPSDDRRGCGGLHCIRHTWLGLSWIPGHGHPRVSFLPSRRNASSTGRRKLGLPQLRSPVCAKMA